MSVTVLAKLDLRVLCTVSKIANYEQLDATNLAYLFIPNQLYEMGLDSSISSTTPACSNIGGQYQKL